MLTQEGCLQRRTRLWNHLPDPVAWVLIGDARHIQYFSNFRINPVSFSADQRALLLLKRDGSATLLADNFVRSSAVCEPFVNHEVIIPWYTHKRSVGNRDNALALALEERRQYWSNSEGLIEPEGVTSIVAEVVAAQPQLRIKDAITGHRTTVGNIIRNLRRQKLPDEVDLLRRCIAAGEAGQAAAFDVIRPGTSELDVYLSIQQAVQRQADCACVVYGDFRATDAKRFQAGGPPTGYRLKDGDLFIADFSVIINGYRSDITNTLAVGTPTDAQLRQFEACRDALLVAESTLRAGAAGRDVYNAASTVFSDRGYPVLSHHCGHGLGLEHPEPPIFVSESDDTLLAGDIVTIEPGLYVEGVGGMRFEHNYLVTEDSSERLSNHRIGLTL